MMQLPPFIVPPPTGEYEKAAEVERKAQELRKDFNAPLPVGYLLLLIVFILFFIVIAVMSRFHLL